MSSELVVPVALIEDVRTHSNADSLELCNVLGYQMCIPKGKYKGGEKVVYFPADTLLTDEWAEKFGVKTYLKGTQKDRVGRVKLRGEPSFGLVVTAPDGFAVGDNMAEYYDCKKYEPPMKQFCGDSAKYDADIDSHFHRFTDVQNGRIFTNVFVDGEEVVFTEKIHGGNGRVGRINDCFVAGSMSVRRKRPVNEDDSFCDWDSDKIKHNLYWHPFASEGVRNLISNFPGNVIVYGEVYGGGIQTLGYDIPRGKAQFAVFGININGLYLDWDDMVSACKKFGVEVVPILWRGAFSLNKAKELADGNSTIAKHIREGTVVYPIKERVHPRVGRVILKFIGTEYELSNHMRHDTKDV